MIIMEITVCVFVALCIFMSGYTYGQKRKELKPESEPDFRGVLMTEPLLCNSLYIHTRFEILDISDPITDIKRPYFNHKFYVVRFESDPEYLFRTLALDKSIIFHENLFQPPGKNMCVFILYPDSNTIECIEESSFVDTKEMALAT